MKKILFLLTSGADSPEKANLGIVTAARQFKSKRYADVKVLLYGPAEKFVTKLDGRFLDAFKELLEGGAIDSACVAIAKNYNVSDDLVKMGIKLEPFGERLSKYVNDDYEVITF